jgi:hypothetical protein
MPKKKAKQIACIVNSLAFIFFDPSEADLDRSIRSRTGCNVPRLAKPQPPRRVCARAAWGTAMIKICLVTTTDRLDVLIPGEAAPIFSGLLPN